MPSDIVRIKIFQKVLHILMVHLLKSPCKFLLSSRFDSLSQRKILIFSFLAINRLKVCTNESVSILQVHSIWTALLAKQVKSAPYLFSFFFLYKKGTKHVNSTICKWWSIKSSISWLVRQFFLSKFSSKQTTFDTLLHQTSNHNVPFDHPKAITSNFTDCQLPSTMGYPLMKPFNYQGCCFAFVTNKKMVNVTEMKA